MSDSVSFGYQPRRQGGAYQLAQVMELYLDKRSSHNNVPSSGSREPASNFENQNNHRGSVLRLNQNLPRKDKLPPRPPRAPVQKLADIHMSEMHRELTDQVSERLVRAFESDRTSNNVGVNLVVPWLKGELRDASKELEIRMANMNFNSIKAPPVQGMVDITACELVNGAVAHLQDVARGVAAGPGDDQHRILAAAWAGDIATLLTKRTNFCFETN